MYTYVGVVQAVKSSIMSVLEGCRVKRMKAGRIKIWFDCVCETKGVSPCAVGVTVPSFAALPYFAAVLAALLAWGFESHDPLTPLSSRRRRQQRRRRRHLGGSGAGGSGAGGCGGVATGLAAMPMVPQFALQLGLLYSATHFTLLYLYQLPELTDRADKVKSEWMGLYVLSDEDEPMVSALKSAQLLSIAGFFAGLCAAGGMSGGGGGRRGVAGGGGGSVSGSEGEGSIQGGGAGSRSFHWPPLGRRGADDDDDELDAPLLGGEGMDGQSHDDDDDEDDDDIDGARLEGGGSENGELLDEDGAPLTPRTPRVHPSGALPIPGLQRRLLAQYTGTLAGFIIVATSLAAKSLLAYPMLIYALVVITSPPTHAAFARR